jgi:hypothetical protein
MEPVRTKNTTRVLGAPRGWDEEKNGTCGGLPITDGAGVMFSEWRPSWRERLRIAFGGRVRLAVFGGGHPPVAVDTEAA